MEPDSGSSVRSAAKPVTVAASGSGAHRDPLSPRAASRARAPRRGTSPPRAARTPGRRPPAKRVGGFAGRERLQRLVEQDQPLRRAPHQRGRRPARAAQAPEQRRALRSPDRCGRAARPRRAPRSGPRLPRSPGRRAAPSSAAFSASRRRVLDARRDVRDAPSSRSTPAPPSRASVSSVDLRRRRGPRLGASGSSNVTVRPSPPARTNRNWSPLGYSCPAIASASGVRNWRSTARFRGRAPRSGVNPSLSRNSTRSRRTRRPTGASAARAAPARPRARGQDLAHQGRDSGRNTTTRSIRLRNSRRNAR